MITLGPTELAIAERAAFGEKIEAWAGRYAGSEFGLAAEAPYVKLVIRSLATRCRKNGILEHNNIQTFLDVFFRKDLSLRQMQRLLAVAADPAKTENAKMSEIGKQFLGARPTQANGFALWKMP